MVVDSQSQVENLNKGFHIKFEWKNLPTKGIFLMYTLNWWVLYWIGSRMLRTQHIYYLVCASICLTLMFESTHCCMCIRVSVKPLILEFRYVYHAREVRMGCTSSHVKDGHHTMTWTSGANRFFLCNALRTSKSPDGQIELGLNRQITGSQQLRILTSVCSSRFHAQAMKSDDLKYFFLSYYMVSYWSFDSALCF